MKKVQSVTKKGFSAIEVLLASSIFVAVVSAFVGAIIFGIQSQKTAGLYNQAALFAEETFEAVRNIRDSGYANLPATDGTYYLSSAGNQWSLISTPEGPIDGFTRSITVSTIDVTSKQLTVNISFNPSVHRTKTLAYTSKITNWISNTEGGGSPKKRGLLAYGNSATSGPITRQYDEVADSFIAPENLPVGATPTSIDVKTSPTKAEAVMTYVDGTGILRAMCYDDSTDIWTEDWSVSVGGDGNAQRYAVAYETTSGDAIVFYTTNNTTINEIAYRTKPGTSSCGSANWSTATNYDTQRTSGQVRWIKAQRDSRAGQDRIFVAWSDTNNDLSAGIWNGSSMGAEPAAAFELNLEYHLAAQDMRAWDLTVESLTGNAMIVWSPFGGTCTANSTSLTASCMRYSRYVTAWTAATTIPTVADRGTNLSIASNPVSNQIVLGAIANDSNDLSLAYWSGSAWTGKANHDITCAATSAYGRIVGTGWLNSGTTNRSVIAYSDSNSNKIDWVIGNNGTFTTQTDFTTSPVMGNLQNWIDLEQDPENLDYVYYLVSDRNNRLWVKRLHMTSAAAFTWTNSDSPGPIEGSLPSNVGHPFAFTFWKYEPIAKNNSKDFINNTFLAFNLSYNFYDKRRYY